MCLNPDQVNSVRAAYLPIANTAGQVVYPPFELGSKTDVFSNNQVDGKPQLSYTILEVMLERCFFDKDFANRDYVRITGGEQSTTTAPGTL
jgi:hypothetical protein